MVWIWLKIWWKGLLNFTQKKDIFYRFIKYKNKNEQKLRMSIWILIQIEDDIKQLWVRNLFTTSDV